ncbi:hypothetical protein [Euzebya sp.]|uniref:hypothetical protein n=1 Tax=Euzebya sp. TaxID=1971409 RepID=UPI0035153493
MLERHTDDDIAVVAAGLVRVVGTTGAADQLRRLYGERRAIDALRPLARDRVRGRVRDRVIVLPETRRSEVRLSL